MSDRGARQGKRLSEDDYLGGWEVWKMRAEEARLPEFLSETAIMLLYLSLGTNAWRRASQGREGE